MASISRQRTVIAALPLVGFGVWVLEVSRGQPNFLWVAMLFAWTLAVCGIAWWLMGDSGQRFLTLVDRHATKIAIALIGGYTLVLLALTAVQTWFFAPGIFPYDTAYYGQLLWNTLHGDILAANLQQEQLYDPPVTSDLAIHVSPILLLFLPIYAALPDTLTLLVVRDLALAGAAWPLFTLARDRSGGAVGVAAVLLYVANPVVNAQAASAFYLLHFAPLTVLFALRAFLDKKFGAFAIWMLAALSLREDLAITFGAFGLLAILRRYPLRWSVIGLLLPILWWALVTVVIQPAFGRAGNARFDDVLTGGSDSPLAMYGVLLNPSWIVDVLARDGLEFFLRIAGWSGYLGALAPEGLIALPALAMQMFIGQVSYVGLDPYSRFAIVPVCALLAASFVAAARMARRFVVDGRAWAVIATLFLPSITVLDGNKDLAQQLAARLVLSNDRAALLEALQSIPDEASLAAPNYLLPYVANRRNLYYAEKITDYRGAAPDYLFLDANYDRLWLNAEQIESFRALSARWLDSGAYGVIWQRGDYALLRRNGN